MPVKLAHGLKDGELIHVSSVSNGLACACVCPGCELPLIAKNNIGNSKEYHFAHATGIDCEHGYQSALHYQAKEVLSRIRTFRVPEVTATIKQWNGLEKHYTLHLDRAINFDDVKLERRTGDIIPDVILTINGRELLVEFAVTHFIDVVKQIRIERLGLPVIEVDLSEWHGRPFRYEDLREIMVHDIGTKTWKYNSVLEKFKKEKNEEVEKEKARQLELQRKLDEENSELLRKFYEKEDVQVFEGDGDNMPRCPLRKKQIHLLLQSWRFNHSVLKQIIQQRGWSGNIYSRKDGSKYITVDGDQHTIIPANNVAPSSEEYRLHQGLKELKTIQKQNDFRCHGCEYNSGYLDIRNRHYEFCQFPKQNWEPDDDEMLESAPSNS